jgi:uncharacterized membrane protein
MRKRIYKSIPALLIGAMVWTMSVADFSYAQGIGTIDAGTTISVRTSETINANDTDGRVFEGVVDKDVFNRRGNVAIPQGSNVELVVRQITDTELAVDLDAVTVNNQRYSLASSGSTVTGERREGIGANSRTATHIGGGAAIGAIIGAIAGGKKGAAIGAGVGAAGGAATQVLTRGKSVRIPAESLLTFRLQQPLSTQSGLSSLNDDNVRASAAYRAGLQAGRSDRDRNLARDLNSSRYRTGQARADYEAGYSRGYDGVQSQSSHITGGLQKPSPQATASSNIRIGRDNFIRWKAPVAARIYVQADNEPLKLFAEGQSGTQEAPWILNGHVYTFIMQDFNGNELGRDRIDLRRRR